MSYVERKSFPHLVGSPVLDTLAGQARADVEERGVADDLPHGIAVGDDASGEMFFASACAAWTENRFDLAVSCLRRAIDANPSNPEYHYTLGRLHKARNDPAAAEAAYREALRFRPDYPDALISLGILLRNLGRLAEAETCQHHALSLDAGNVLALINLGNVQRSLSKLTDATVSFRRAIELNPRSAEAHQALGRILLEQDDSAASHHFAEALNLSPEYFDAAEGLGLAHNRAGQFELAIDALITARRLRPAANSISLPLANAYFGARRYDEACGQFELLLREDPHSAIAKAGLASVLAARGQFTRPRKLFEAALASQPDNPSVRRNYALFLLRNGDYQRAWSHYETRWEREEHVYRGFPQPRWCGESLAGKTLLITCEQGLGDEVMFASIFPEIYREAAHCIIECEARLEPLFQRSFPGVTTFGVQRRQKDWYQHLARNVHRLPAFDVWIPAGSLPGYRRLDASAFPQHRGYLTADRDRTKFWKARLNEFGPGLKVGVSWRGGTATTNAASRSMTLQQLRPLLACPGIQFVNLQYGNCSAEIDSFAAETGTVIHQLVDAGTQYDEAAALICALDLVITVCTAVAHLSGALGQPVWVIAPHVAEWRYGRDGPSMIWYPSMRIFRQPKPDAWNPVIAEVKRALSKFRSV